MHAVGVVKPRRVLFVHPSDRCSLFITAATLRAAWASNCWTMLRTVATPPAALVRPCTCTGQRGRAEMSKSAAGCGVHSSRTTHPQQNGFATAACAAVPITEEGGGGREELGQQQRSAQLVPMPAGQEQGSNQGLSAGVSITSRTCVRRVRSPLQARIQTARQLAPERAGVG